MIVVACRQDLKSRAAEHTAQGGEYTQQLAR